MKTLDHNQSMTSASPMPTEWLERDWIRFKKHVKKLQRRIDKAIEAGDRRKAKSLKRTMNRSFSAKVLGVKLESDSPLRKPAA